MEGSRSSILFRASFMRIVISAFVLSAIALFAIAFSFDNTPMHSALAPPTISWDEDLPKPESTKEHSVPSSATIPKAKIPAATEVSDSPEVANPSKVVNQPKIPKRSGVRSSPADRSPSVTKNMPSTDNNIAAVANEVPPTASKPKVHAVVYGSFTMVSQPPKKPRTKKESPSNQTRQSSQQKNASQTSPVLNNTFVNIPPVQTTGFQSQSPNQIPDKGSVVYANYPMANPSLHPVRPNPTLNTQFQPYEMQSPIQTRPIKTGSINTISNQHIIQSGVQVETALSGIPSATVIQSPNGEQASFPIGFGPNDVGYIGPGDMRTHLWNDHSSDLLANGITNATLMSMPMAKVQKWHNFFHGTEDQPAK